jgi:hypothetical protein
VAKVVKDSGSSGAKTAKVKFFGTFFFFRIMFFARNLRDPYFSKIRWINLTRSPFRIRICYIGIRISGRVTLTSFPQDDKHHRKEPRNRVQRVEVQGTFRDSL